MAAEKDVVVIGAGPAGMAAVLWCAELGLRAVMIEQNDEPGGQLRWIHNPIRNYPGCTFNNGAECVEAFDLSLAGRDLELVKGTTIDALDAEAVSVSLSDGRTIKARSVIIATGVRRRKLGVPGEAEFYGRGILASGSGERRSVSGKRVAVVGGGDAALENALILSEFADEVTIVHRRGEFSARAEFTEAIRANPRIVCRMNATVERFGGAGRLEHIAIVSEGAAAELIDVDHAVIRIGVEPNSELAGSSIATDPQGYIIVDAECRTNVPSVYAVGDVANPVAPTIASAVGMGATAARSIANFIRDLE